MPDLRESITTALQALTTAPLRDASKHFLRTLGYESDRTRQAGTMGTLKR